jgi:23S rRNA pseudouridine1911/1915/1917 synthase
VEKTYLALVHGHVHDDAGEIDAAIGRAPDSALMSADPSATARKNAVTRFRVLERFGLQYSLVEARPLTGRLHQIRVHLSSMGHAIVADEFYGASDDEHLLDRQALHAAEVAFAHPLTGDALVVSASPPPDFQQAVARLRGNRD